MSPALVIALYLIVLHRVDGGEVFVNPAQIVVLHAAAGPKNKNFTQTARCVVGLSDGKWLGVIEGCEVVRRMLEEQAAGPF